MADDKKAIGPDVGIPTEAPEQPTPEPVLTDAEAVMLEHEGQAVLFEMGEAVPDPADAVTHAEVEEPAAPEHPRLKRNRRSRLIPARTIPPRHIPARWWIFPPPVTRRPRRRKRRSSRSRPPKRTRLPSPADAVRPRMARPLPIRQSRPNLGTKSPKASPPRRSLSWIRAALPLVRRSRRNRLRPVTPPAPKKRRSFISTCLTCIRSKIIPLASGTMWKCRGLWSRSRRQGVDQPALVRPREDNGYFAPICYLFESFPCIRKKLCIT